MKNLRAQFFGSVCDAECFARLSKKLAEKGLGILKLADGSPYLASRYANVIVTNVPLNETETFLEIGIVVLHKRLTRLFAHAADVHDIRITAVVNGLIRHYPEIPTRA